MTNQEDVAWCEMVWGSLRDGGMWAVPRSGLIFQKRGAPKQLVLFKRAPHDPEMPVTARRLREIQDGDVEAIRQRFVQLGIEVLDEAA